MAPSPVSKSSHLPPINFFLAVPNPREHLLFLQMILPLSGAFARFPAVSQQIIQHPVQHVLLRPVASIKHAESHARSCGSCGQPRNVCDPVAPEKNPNRKRSKRRSHLFPFGRFQTFQNKLYYQRKKRSVFPATTRASVRAREPLDGGGRRHERRDRVGHREEGFYRRNGLRPVIAAVVVVVATMV
jgi:hypothetical protein